MSDPNQNPYGQNPYGQQPYGQQPYGQYGYQNYPPPAPGWNGFAIAGFICAFLCSILGIIFSAIALSQIKDRGQRGQGLAIAGLVISIASIVIGIAVVASSNA